MMTRKQQSLIEMFIDSLPDDQKNIYKEITYCLIELGYISQKQKIRDFVLSFKHKETGKVISKMGIRKQNGFVSIRYFACKNISN